MTPAVVGPVPGAVREGGAFGAWVTSDIALPLCTLAPRGSRPVLRVREGQAGRRQPADLPLGHLGVAAAFAGHVAPATGTVWLHRRPPLTGPCWGAILGLALPHLVHAGGRHVLHASGVSRGPDAVAFLGLPRAGKSTVAAALVRHGWRLVADDALAVATSAGRATADAAFPAIRLFDQAIRWFAIPGSTPTVRSAPAAQKRWVLLDQARQWHGPAPARLGCLCLLDRSGRPQGRLRGRDAVFAVLAASYRSPVEDGHRTALAFHAAHALAEAVPVIRLALPAELPPPDALAARVTAGLAALAGL
jgi:hypothetical protein